MEWEDHQSWERRWWGDCTNTFSEETKQITYAHRMGLINTQQGESWPVYDMAGKSVLDIGGGPVSMLLKTINLKRGVIIDPGYYPRWIIGRYQEKDIQYFQTMAEDDWDWQHYVFDECWMYNVLQHTLDPQKIVENVKRSAKLIRVFDWLNIPPCDGHPQELKYEQMNEWFGGPGMMEKMNENGCYGPAYYGTFYTGL